jgi:hypothetical protein
MSSRCVRCNVQDVQDQSGAKIGTVRPIIDMTAPWWPFMPGCLHD